MLFDTTIKVMENSNQFKVCMDYFLLNVTVVRCVESHRVAKF